MSMFTNGSLMIYCGDSREKLAELPTGFANMIVTSPPYWNLRNYDDCGVAQIGAEETPEDYIANLVAVFHEAKRVLHDSGTLWLNLGDTYNDKNLCGLPWMVAFALRNDGWILRQDIIWHKRNPLPLSLTDRCVTAHEYLFLFAKQKKYHFDHIAIRELATDKEYISKGHFRPGDEKFFQLDSEKGRTRAGLHKVQPNLLRNKRSVWTLSTQPSKLPHFAAFPEKLVEPCIMAGTSEAGCCSKCGSPLARVVDRLRIPTREPQSSKLPDMAVHGIRDPLRHITSSITSGWRWTCECGARPSIPCVVLDPFFGVGTTGVVANRLGRNCIGIDLSRKYCEIARDRLSQLQFKFTGGCYDGLSDSVEAGEE